MHDLTELYRGLDALYAADTDTDRAAAFDRVSHPDATWHGPAPIDACAGRDAVLTRFIEPLATALDHRHRRPEVFLSGESRVQAGETWVSGFGHLVGNFQAPLLGLRPNRHLVFLRYGEFYRLRDGRIAEARILFDWVDLMRQIGCAPLPLDLGTEGLFPGPATHDGVRLTSGPGEGDNATVRLVEAMLGDLKSFDPDTFDSAGQSGEGGYWHPDMLWYGPGGIGANLSYDGFQKDHRVPFLSAFPDRIGGNHFARFGDGRYACSGGWPSITATHGGDYLGVAATHRSITMRVMDWWREESGQLIENWVFIDLVDLFNQLGVDLFERAIQRQTDASIGE